MDKRKGKLAIDGGTPVRKKLLCADYVGTSVYGREELELVTEVVQNRLPFREYGNGTPHMVVDLELFAREYFNVPYALATATGSGSFFCAMAGLGLGPADEVIIPAFSWWTDYEAPLLFGSLPVFADIDRSMSLDPDDFKRKITSKTKAVIIVHYQGAAGDLDQILRIAENHNISVIEDCAQACGGSCMGRKLGSFGKASCFSFQQNKIVCSGDGGLLLTSDPIVFERAVRFHDLGMVRDSLAAQLGNRLQTQAFAGCQFRMNEVTGALALAQLRKLDTAILNRIQPKFRRLKRIIQTQCPDMKFRDTKDEGNVGCALYMDLGSPELARWFTRALNAEGILTGPKSGCCNLLESDLVKKRLQSHPDLPPFGKGFGGESVRYDPSDCPNTDRIINSMVCVALDPTMSEDDIDDIARAVTKLYHARCE